MNHRNSLRHPCVSQMAPWLGTTELNNKHIQYMKYSFQKNAAILFEMTIYIHSPASVNVTDQCPIPSNVIIKNFPI